MMHCTMDDLLALRDGEGSVWARQHLDACPACRAELEALYQRIAQLKALPALTPARDRWPAIRDILRGERERRRRKWGAWSVAAAAVLAGVLVFRPFGGGRQAYADELAKAKHQSATLESALQRYDPDGRVCSGRQAALAAQLEDQIAAIDGQLALVDQMARAREAELMKLWRQRVDLMQRLVQVRVTRAVYVGL